LKDTLLKMYKTETGSLDKIAFLLSLFTIFYNIVEGLLSVYFGVEEEALTLFGFGSDSFIEAISGFGIAHMVIRIQKHNHEVSDRFEKTALKVTGFSFYALCMGLSIGIVLRLVSGESPKSTIPGVIISLISILVMIVLLRMKTNIGKKLNSQPILADASCTKICIYMSVVLLGSSMIYELTKINYIDVVGTLGIIYFSYQEGKEAFEKAEGVHDCSCH